MSGFENADITVTISRHQTIGYMTLASLTILTLDWLLLFGDEVELIWKSKWSFAKFLYFITRYPTFIDTSLSAVYYLSPGINVAQCFSNYRASTWITASGMAFAELIFIWRTYALWNRSKKILYSVVAIWTLWVLGNIYGLVKFTTTLQFQPLPVITGCNMSFGSNILFVCYATLFVMELVIVSLTVIRGIRQIRLTRSPLVVAFYRDGILFFICLTILSFANVILLLTAPVQFLNTLNTFTRSMHSILCCRVIINLRGAAKRDISSDIATHASFPSTVSNIRFQKQTAETTSGGVPSEVIETFEVTTESNLSGIS